MGSAPAPGTLTTRRAAAAIAAPAPGPSAARGGAPAVAAGAPGATTARGTPVFARVRPRQDRADRERGDHQQPHETNGNYSFHGILLTAFSTARLRVGLAQPMGAPDP